jgi:two-component system, NtrC family, response regulator HydG
MEQTATDRLVLSSSQTDGSDNSRDNFRLGELVGRSLIMQRLFTRLRQAAMHLRILALEGEPGTGKTLVAKTLHRLGSASGAKFVACTASRFLAMDSQPLLQEVRGGTLFLTRVNELNAQQQARLFDFLEWWEHRNGHDDGGFLPRQLFVSSQQPLRQLSVTGTLRSDLCYRLTAIRFTLPPLRERREDIAALAEWFAVRYGEMHEKPVRGLGPGSLARLLPHPWPGNVRELETVMANAAMECEGQWIRPIDIPSLQVAPERPPAAEASDRAEGDDPNLDRMILRHINSVLAKTGGNKLRAAQLLGISRSTLYRLLEPGSEGSQPS